MTRYIIATILIIGSGALFFFETMPMYDDVQAAQADIATYNSALDKANEIKTQKQTLLNTAQQISQSDVDRLQKLLPDHVDNVALILDLDNLAARYGMSLQNVDVSTPANSTSGGTIAGAAGSPKYDSLTMRFSTGGSYPTFVQFLTALESSLRIVDIVSLAVSQDSSVVGANGLMSLEPTYRYDITLRTYWLK